MTRSTFSAARRSAFALFAALVLAVPAARAADHLEGSGRVTTETRAASGFQGIDLRGSMNLVLRQSGREGVELRGDDNILALIETRVVDRGGVPTLEINTRRGADYSTHHDVVVTVDLKTLSALSISGSGDARADALKTGALRVSLSGSGNLRVNRLDADELATHIAGSGDIRLAGHAARASFSIAGSGDVDAASLDGDEVTVNIAGSGDAAVTARKTLTVSIAGSGDVSYGGDPVVKSSVAGSGSVRKR